MGRTEVFFPFPVLLELYINTQVGVSETLLILLWYTLILYIDPKSPKTKAEITWSG